MIYPRAILYCVLGSILGVVGFCRGDTLQILAAMILLVAAEVRLSCNCK